ncbi:MAG: Hint domain-containing protein [Pseudomonadota bacterium]
MTDFPNQALFLGVFTDFDTDDGASIEGVTAGGPDDELFETSVTDIIHTDADGDDLASDGTGDTITYSVNGAPPITSDFDNIATITGTITYADGTPPFTGTFLIDQAADGSVFVVSFSAAGAPGNVALEAGRIESFTVVSIDAFDAGTSDTLPNAEITFVCFARGTRLETPDGPRRVEEIAAGDLVTTVDRGPQQVRWIGSRTVAGTGNLAPVVITAGTLGAVETLVVSPQHRILVQGYLAELLFGAPEVLVPAKHLVNGDTIYRREGGLVEYFHILFDQHEIVLSEGVPTESFFPTSATVGEFEAATRDELLALFPEFADTSGAPFPTCRTVLRGYEAQALLHAQRNPAD